jgi:hypothetical protein
MTRLMSRRRSRDKLQPAVGIAEEADVGHPHRGRGRLLLGPAQRRHLLTRGPVEATGVPVGHDAVGDLGTRRRPGGDGARAAEVDVVGVREHAQDALGVLGRLPRRGHGHAAEA